MHLLFSCFAFNLTREIRIKTRKIIVVEMAAAIKSSHFNFLKQYGASRKFQCLKPLRKEPTKIGHIFRK
jgi:hypothetical protein